MLCKDLEGLTNPTFLRWPNGDLFGLFSPMLGILTALASSFTSILSWFGRFWTTRVAVLPTFSMFSDKISRTPIRKRDLYSVFFLAPLKFDFFRIFFIGLKWSLGIFRKSQKVSALSFDHKGAKIGDMSIAGPYGPPPMWNRVKAKNKNSKI